VKIMAMDNSEPLKKLVVIRIRGKVNVRDKVEDTLKMLRLHKINHAVIIDYSI